MSSLAPRNYRATLTPARITDLPFVKGRSNRCLFAIPRNGPTDYAETCAIGEMFAGSIASMKTTSLVTAAPAWAQGTSAIAGVARDESGGVLPGVTRICTLQIAREMGLAVEERAFTPDELLAAREAFVSAAGSLVLPVVEVDGKPIGTGTPGPLSAEIRRRYIALLKAQ